MPDEPPSGWRRTRGLVVNTPSAELALPRGPDGVQAPAPAGGQLAELVVRLLGELEDVAGEGEGVVVLEDGEEVVRVDAGAGDGGHEEGAAAVTVARGGEGVYVEVALALVVWARCLDDHDSALDESDCNGTVAQHGG